MSNVRSLSVQLFLLPARSLSNPGAASRNLAGVRERALICRIDDVSRAVTVESTLLQREFGRAQWAEIAERVRRWGAGVAGVSKQLDDALAKPPSQAAAALAVSALAPPALASAGSHKAGPSGRR